MTNIRRYFRDGQICFLTHVTHTRAPILLDNFDLLWKAFEETGILESDRLLAWAALPDHVHMLLDPKGLHVPNLVRRIKLKFSASYRTKLGLSSGRVWQYRYWDHIIRDQTDFNNHVDYIHYNPVKHGLTCDPFSYEYSSIHAYFKRGVYARDWGVNEDPTVPGDYGE